MHTYKTISKYYTLYYKFRFKALKKCLKS